MPKKTKKYGLVLSEPSEKVCWPEERMGPDFRSCGYEATLRGDHFEVIYSYLREGNHTEIFIGGFPQDFEASGSIHIKWR